MATWRPLCISCTCRCRVALCCVLRCLQLENVIFSIGQMLLPAFLPHTNTQCLYLALALSLSVDTLFNLLSLFFCVSFLQIAICDDYSLPVDFVKKRPSSFDPCLAEAIPTNPEHWIAPSPQTEFVSSKQTQYNIFIYSRYR